MNPWIGVALVAIGVAAIVIFAFFHLQGAADFAAIVAVGLALLQGSQHAATAKENNVLKSQLRQNGDRIIASARNLPRSPDEVQR